MTTVESVKQAHDFVSTHSFHGVTEVGQQLGISALTVKSHLARIGHKLNTGDRAAMVARVLRAGLIT